MGGSSGDEASVVDVQGSNGREEGDEEEKIFVAVRLRPMSEKEASRNDLSDWECINNDTVILKNILSERSLFPTAYTFDRVFSGCCKTKEVYEGCAKKFALSVVEGINATIFAYGQTSSGKTYTMNGIMEYAVSDIYYHMEKQKHRDFLVKFSAMEIYNEAVRDLLSSDATPLRLLDDPEKGTIVEKITEEKLRNRDHLMQLLSICEAHRQMGETFLNEASSRSHQIIRLTVDSCAHQFSGAESSATLSATVNFVDLAGSERASQTLSAGVRLKEGCHINRSLLTLGTVIRKLSKGRNKHVPYRDSKLTRILQNSLGGNAKTSIICTICPARSHVEQSKNTLLFATCAKGVSTKAHVNVVMSDKALVRHLQRELSRLENELRICGSNSVTSTTGSNSAALLREKELLIQKMDGEIQELIRQRDFARSQADTLLLAATQITHYPTFQDTTAKDLVGNHIERFPVNGLSPISSPHTPRFQSSNPCAAWDEVRADRDNSEASWKEVHCIPMEELGSESRGSGRKGNPVLAGDNNGTNPNALRQKIMEMQETIDRLVGVYPSEQSPLPREDDLSCSHGVKKMTRSRSCGSIVPVVSRSFWPSLTEKHTGGAPPNLSGVDVTLSKAGKYTGRKCFTKKDSHMSSGDSVDSSEETVGGALEEDSSSRNSTIVLNKATNEWMRVFSLDSPKLSMGGGENMMMGDGESSGGGNCEWREMFERERVKIIKLWDKCRVPLIHRSYFFLLFKGDPSDAAYIAVELRRLIFLEARFRADARMLASASKFMMREREMLKKQVGRRMRGKEREEMYVKWGIGLDKKQRKGQLVQRLWRDTENLEHVRESAVTVAKLAGFRTKGEGDAPKEMVFGLSLSPSPSSHPRRSSFLWRRGNSTSQLLL